jgi:protein TonB
MGEQGAVIVRVVINTNGTAGSVTVEKSSGYERLDEAALNAVKRALFKPPSENGVPFIGVALVPINFSTQD